MFARFSLHPVLRHGGVLMLVLIGASSTWWSWTTNPHSAAWMVSFHASVAALIVTLQSARRTQLHKSFALYLVILAYYLLVVWFHHVCVPGTDPDQTKRFVALVAPFLAPGSIFIAVAHLRFALDFTNSQSRIMRGLEYLGWAASSVFLTLNIFGRFLDDFFWAGYTWVPTLSGAYKYFFFHTTILLTIGSLVPIIALFRTVNHQRRLQLFYYIIGSSPLWFACWINFLISLAGC